MGGQWPALIARNPHDHRELVCRIAKIAPHLRIGDAEQLCSIRPPGLAHVRDARGDERALDSQLVLV